MSIVLVVRKAGSTTIASDSFERCGDLRVASGEKIIDADRVKVFIGHTGDAVLLDCIECFLGLGGRQSKPGWEIIIDCKAAVFDFGLKLRTYLKERCHLIDEKPSEGSAFAHFNNSLILVSKLNGRAWALGGDLSVTEVDKFWAIGSGNHAAMGALTVLYETARNSIEIAEEAIAATCRCIATCEGPEVTCTTRYEMPVPQAEF